jgi:hypothetical protein
MFGLLFRNFGDTIYLQDNEPKLQKITDHK